MSAPGGAETGDEQERYSAALVQLATEGRPDQAVAFAALVAAGHLTVAQVLEIIAFAETMADEIGRGSVSSAEAGELARELGLKHLAQRAQ